MPTRPWSASPARGARSGRTPDCDAGGAGTGCRGPVPGGSGGRERRRPGALRALVAALVVLVVAALAAPARAQSCGGCAGPAVAGGTGRTDWLGEGDLTVRISEEYEVKDRTFRGHRRVVNDFEETLRISRTAVTVRYGLTDEWSLELGLTHPRFAYALTPPGGTRRKEIFRGPGDSELLAGRAFALAEPEPDVRPFPLDEAEVPSVLLPPPRPFDEGPRLSVWAGVSLPTGSAERPDPRIVTRDVSVTNLQTGTGTFDPTARVRLDLPAWGLDWFVEAGARVPVYENRYDYRTGAAVAFVGGARAALADDVSAGLAVTWQDVARDEFDGERVAVGGGRWIYVTPSVSWDLSERATIDLSVRITASRDTETKLVDSGRAVQVGLTWRF